LAQKRVGLNFRRFFSQTHPVTLVAIGLVGVRTYICAFLF
jgi:hypothetical protein